MNDHTIPSQGKAEAPLNLNKFGSGPLGGVDPAAPDAGGQTLFIKKTAAESVARSPGSAAQDGGDSGLATQDMLGLITYCYVRGVFSSKEIAERLKGEPELRKRFGRRLPEEQDIRGFRRRYAAEIEELLENVYRAFPPKDTKLSAEQGATETEIVRREAAERLHDASWEDAMRRHLH